MPDRDEELKAFYHLLRQRQISGNAGRVQIADRLAKMTLAELLRVPPWVIVRLGPKGLALLAERSAVIRVKNGGSPHAVEKADAIVVVRPPKRSWFAELRRRRPLWWESGRKAAVTTVVGLLLIGGFPFIERTLRTLENSGSYHDLCSQLDRWTGGCIYRVSSSSFDLTQAAVRLALPVAALAEANPLLDPIRPLQLGTQIVVPRRAGINLR